MVTGFHLSAALGSALFHHARTGEGQLVHLSHVRSAVWSVALTLPSILTGCKIGGDIMPIMAPPSGVEWAEKSNPMINCHATKDGAVIQVIAVGAPGLLRYAPLTLTLTLP